MKRLLLAIAVIAALLAIPQAAINGAPAAAAGCANEIACENLLPGTDPEIWDISGAGDDSIQGFATQISVNRGEQIDFKIKTDASAYTIQIYRTGYYQGLGARFIDDVSPIVPQSQPVCATDLTTDRLDCANWAVSASWDVPATAVSGVYLAVLTRAGGWREPHHLHRPRRRQPLRPGLPDLRHHVAGLQQVRRGLLRRRHEGLSQPGLQAFPTTGPW